MSRRRLEAGISAPTNFSLRTIATGVGVTATAAQAPISVSRGGGAPPAIPTQAGLSFKFESFSTRPSASASPPKPMEAPRLPANFFTKAPTTGVHNSAEAMRLTAVVDDLTQRLRKTTEVKNQLEGQVARINAALVQERSNATAKLTALKSEVSTVHASEMRLRTELASRPAVKEVDTQQFATRCRAALELEETNARAADAEAKVGHLAKRAETLGVEVKLLESRKDAAMDLQMQALSKDEVEALVAKAAEAQAAIDVLDERRAALEDDIERFGALRDAHREETVGAEAGLFKANEATAAAVADEAAAKAQVQSMLLEHGDVCGKVRVMQQRLKDLGTAVDSPPTFKVTGASAPERDFESAPTALSQIASTACCGTGLAYHFALDAPLNITAADINAAAPSDDAGMNGMVQALVSDLQSYFKFAAEDHARIGRATVEGSEAAAPAVGVA